MGGKIKRFFDRISRNSNDEIDALLKSTSEHLEKFYQSQIDNLDRMSGIQNEVSKNYGDYLSDNKKLRDEIVSEQNAIKAELEKQRRETVIALRRMVEVLTQPDLRMDEQRKQLDAIL